MTTTLHRSLLLVALLLMAQLGLAGHVHGVEIDTDHHGHGSEHCLVCPLHADKPWHGSAILPELPPASPVTHRIVAVQPASSLPAFLRYAIRAPPLSA